MMNAHATAVRVPETQRGGQPPCEHPTLKLETSGFGSFTGNFYCVDCGESVPNKHRHLILD
jgi:hypothetical protein